MKNSNFNFPMMYKSSRNEFMRVGHVVIQMEKTRVMPYWGKIIIIIIIIIIVYCTAR